MQVPELYRLIGLMEIMIAAGQYGKWEDELLKILCQYELQYFGTCGPVVGYAYIKETEM